MGCASSKHLRRQALRDNWTAPLPRSVSMPVFHRPQREGDSYHMVALTSSSYGLLKVDSPGENGGSFLGLWRDAQDENALSSLSAKKWIANVKLKPVKEEDKRKTGKDGDLETINTWELMEGLEDGLSPSPLKRALSSAMIFEHGKRRSLDKSVSFHTVREVDAHFARMGSPINSVWSKYHNFGGKENVNQNVGSSPATASIEQEELMVISPLSLENKTLSAPSSELSLIKKNVKKNLSFDEDTENFSASPLQIGISPDSCRLSNSPLFDPAIVATFEKALDSLSEDDWHTTSGCTPSSSPSQENATSPSYSCSDAGSPQLEMSGSAWNTRENRLFDVVSEEKVDKSHGKKLSFSKISPMDFEEDWKAPDSLSSFELKCPPGGEGKVVLYFTSLRGIRKTYEDCSELRAILQGTRVHVDDRDVWMHSKFKQELTDLFGKVITVPRLFIKGRYIGQAEEVKQLHEEGILVKLLDGLPTEDSRQVCDACGDVRFVPCLTCSGSCKVIREDNVVSRCPDCNENGLIMCPLCN